MPLLQAGFNPKYIAHVVFSHLQSGVGSLPEQRFVAPNHEVKRVGGSWRHVNLSHLGDLFF
jgi:hypothetical protein